MGYYGAFANNLTDNLESSRSKKIRSLAGKKIAEVRQDKGHVIPRCRQLNKQQCSASSRGIYQPCKVVSITGNGKDGEWFCDYRDAGEEHSTKAFQKILKDVKDKRGLSMEKVYRKWGATDGIKNVRILILRALIKISRYRTKDMLKKISEARLETIQYKNLGSSTKSAMNRAMQCDLLTPSHAPVESGMRHYADSCRRSQYCELVTKEEGKRPEGLTDIILRRKTLQDLKQLRCAPSKDLGPLREYSMKMMRQRAGGRVPTVTVPRGHRRNRDGRLVLYQLDPSFYRSGNLKRLSNEAKKRRDAMRPGLMDSVSRFGSTLTGNMFKNRVPLGSIPKLEDDDVLMPCERFTYDTCPAYPGGPITKFVSGRLGRSIKNPYDGVQHCVRTFTGCKEPSADNRNPFARYRDSLSDPPREYKSMTKAIHDDVIRDQRLPMAKIRAIERAFEARTGAALPYRMRTYTDGRLVYNLVRRNTVPDELRELGLNAKAAKLIEVGLRPILATRMTLDL